MEKEKDNISGLEYFLVWYLVCLPKDVLDGMFNFMFGSGIILNRITNIPVMITLGLWALIRMKKFPTISFFSVAGVEEIPVLGTLPTWTLWMLFLYLKQKAKKEIK